jgi:UDP-glucose 4-epimerase
VTSGSGFIGSHVVAQLLEHIDYWREAPVWEPDTIADATQGWFKYFGKS